MIQKVIFGFLTAAVLITGCARQDNLNSVIGTAPVAYNQDREPNYASTLNTEGTQTPDVKNIFRFGKVNNRLYRGGLPTDSDLQALKDFKIKTIVTFRGLGDPSEPAQIAAEKKVAESLGMKFVNIQVPFDKPIPDKIIKTFLSTVTNVKNQPLYVHCKGGRDRTGSMVAFYRIKFDNFKPQQALEEMKTYTFNPVDYPIFTKQVLEFNPAKY